MEFLGSGGMYFRGNFKRKEKKTIREKKKKKRKKIKEGGGCQPFPNKNPTGSSARVLLVRISLLYPKIFVLFGRWVVDGGWCTTFLVL